MKTLILTTVLLLSVALSQAQYCGNSGPSVCTSGNNLTQPSFLENIPCIPQGVYVNVIIPIKNFDQILINGQMVNIQSLIIDSIENLPMGLCWATNKTSPPGYPNLNVFSNSEQGCIAIRGITFDNFGQYKLRVKLSATIGNPMQSITKIDHITAFLRVSDPFTGLCPDVDTNQNVPFMPFGSALTDYAQLSGRAYVDLNGNDQYDSNDLAFANEVMKIGNSAYALTGPTGIYNSYVLPGSYEVQPHTNSLAKMFGYSPYQRYINAPSAGYSYSGNDFIITVPSNVCVGNLSVSAYSPPPRPGFDNKVKVVLVNVISGQPIGGTLKISYPSEQEFVSGIPYPNAIDSIQHFVTYTIGNLYPGALFMPVLTFSTPPSTALLGNQFLYSAEFYGSGCSNFDSLQDAETATVVGSHDPNDKAVSPIGFSDNHAVHPTTPLTYTIRFQNTGTFYAQNVVVVDTISTHLDMSTLRVLATSHPYEIAVEQNRAVKFLFNNIMLPDSFTNEPESHGYIKYSIKPISTVSNGTLVTNRADIYFDFNPPILTNTVYNTLDNTLSIQSFGSASNLLKVYPNPNQQGVWYVRCEATLLNQSMKVLDMSGRLIHEQQLINTEQQLQLPDLMPGMYLLQAGEWIGKLLKQ